MKIVFSYLSIAKRFNSIAIIRKLIKIICKEEEKRIGEINIIFTNNPRILEINKIFLNHSYYTDVITFGNNSRAVISGDIYISIDQVIINAAIYETEVLTELIRVIIHGVLHLIGYNDKNEKEQITMRWKEDTYLYRFKEINIIGSSEFKI